MRVIYFYIGPMGARYWRKPAGHSWCLQALIYLGLHSANFTDAIIKCIIHKTIFVFRIKYWENLFCRSVVIMVEPWRSIAAWCNHNLTFSLNMMFKQYTFCHTKFANHCNWVKDFVTTINGHLGNYNSICPYRASSIAHYLPHVRTFNSSLQEITPCWRIHSQVKVIVFILWGYLRHGWVPSGRRIECKYRELTICGGHSPRAYWQYQLRGGWST